MKKFLIIFFVLIFVAYSLLYYYWVEKGIVESLDPITPYQHKHLRITFFSSFITTLALIVAVLKDDIRSLWEYSKLTVAPKTPIFLIEETKEVLALDGVTTNIVAKHYEVILEIHNSGSIPARDCTLNLDELVYKVEDIPQVFDVSLSDTIKWKGTNTEKMLITSKGGKGSISVVKFVSETSGTSDGGQSEPPVLLIAGIEANKEVIKGGKWEATYVLNSDKGKSYRYKLEISWTDCKWEKRLEEMKKRVKIKEVK